MAQQWDFASEHLQRTAPGAAGESALAKALAEALRANNRPAVPPNNHITQQRLAQLGFVHPAGGMMGGGMMGGGMMGGGMMGGGMMGGAMAAQRGSGVFHAVRAIFLARSAFERSSLLAVSLTRRSQPFSSTTTSRSSALRARFLTGPSDPTR